MAEGEGEPDPVLYFFDPFGHGLAWRGVNVNDARQAHFSPSPEDRPRLKDALPIIGLREVALAFDDHAGMLERPPRAYDFAFLKEQAERDFAPFTLAPHAAEDGQGTPQRWLYAWDPQGGVADRVETLVRMAALPSVRGERGLVVRDPSGHGFEFLALR